jgi:hypothetical protein
MENTISVIEVLTQAGPWGAIVAGLGLYTWRLHKRLEQVQDGRVRDVQKEVETLLEQNDKWAEISAEQTEATLSLKAAVDRLAERNGNRG